MNKQGEMQNVVSEIRKHYEGSVKIMIDDGLYGIAGYELANINFIDIQPNINEIKMYHSGGMFLASSQLLEEKVKTENEKPEKAIEFFEGYLAQLELSIKSGNRFDNRIS